MLLTALLFPTDNAPARPPLDLPQGRCFFDVGLACSHTDLADGADAFALGFSVIFVGVIFEGFLSMRRERRPPSDSEQGPGEKPRYLSDAELDRDTRERMLR